MIYTGILARMVSQDSFALMGVVLSIMGFAEIFSQVGIGPAIIQRKDLHAQHLTGAFYTSLALGVTFTLGFIVAAPLIAKSYNIAELEPIIQVVCTSFTISALAVVPRSMMLKEMKFKNFFIAGMISIVGGNLIVGLSLAYAGWDVWAYVWALFAQNTLMTISFWILQPTKIKFKWEWSYTQDLLGYGGASSLFNALNYAATKVDVLLLPKYASQLPASNRSPLDTAGLYERSAYVMSLPITIMAKLSDNVLFSGMSKMQDQQARLRRLMLIGNQFLGILVIPICVFISFFSKEIITIYLGPSYEEAASVLQVLFIAIIFRTLTRLTDSLLRAVNAVLRGSIIKAFYLVIMIVGVVVAIPYGIQMIAWSIVATTAIHYLMSIFLSQRLIDVPIFKQLGALVPGIVLGLFNLVVLFSLDLIAIFNESPHLVKLIIGGMVWGVSTLALILAFPSILRANDIHPSEFLPKKILSLPLLNRLGK